MRGVVFTGNSTVEIREIPDPRPKEGEALIQIGVSAICGSELGQYRSEAGSNGSVPGHEMMGRVIEVNSTRWLKKGDRVSVQIMAGCGECFHCKRGEPMHCASLIYLHGGHGELVCAPEMCCLPLPDEIDDELGVLLGGDLVGTSYRAVKRLGVTALDTVAVLGAGPIGLGVLAILRFLGARTIVSEVSEYRRRLAETLGANHVFDANEVNVTEATSDLTGGLGADITIDCSGTQDTLTAALECVRCFGKVALVGEKRNVTINPSDQIIHKEIEILGSFYFNAADFKEILNLHRRGLSTDGIVTHRFGLMDADRAFATFASGESGKVLIVR